MESPNESYLRLLGTSVLEDDGTSTEETAEPHLQSRETLVGGTGLIPLIDSMAIGDGNRAVVLCAEVGMGRTTALTRSLEIRASNGDLTRYDDYSELNAEEASCELENTLTWCRTSLKSGQGVALAVDNLPAGDEADAESHVSILREMVSLGAHIYVSALPEAETMVELFGEARCFWSCNMRTPRPLSTDDGAMYDKYVQGVPRLAEALRCAKDANVHSPMGDPGYQHALGRLIARSFRSQMMIEEQRIKAVLLLLGNGTFAEVERCVGCVEPEAWLLLARDAPLFGVDTLNNTFCCAGACVPDGISVVFGILKEVVAPWSATVAMVAHQLAARGDYVRAANVSLLCEAEDDRCGIALQYAAPFINAGELSVVEDALAELREAGMYGSPGFGDAEHLVAMLDKPMPTLEAAKRMIRPVGLSTYAVLAASCRSMLYRAEPVEARILYSSEDRLASELALHARMLDQMVHGHFEAAYRQLLDVSVRLRATTVAASLLEADYVLCSLLIGISPQESDRVALHRSFRLLESAGMLALAAAQESVVPLGALLAGRRSCTTAFEAHVNQASRFKNHIAHGVYLLASAIVDVRAHVFLRAHVRLEQACKLFESAHDVAYLLGCARLIDVCVRYQLSETVTRAEVLGCKDLCPTLDDVTAVLCAAISTKRRRQYLDPDRIRGRSCPRDIHWILNVMAHDFGYLSQHVRSVLPQGWYDSVQRGASEADAFAERCEYSSDVHLSHVDVADTPQRPVDNTVPNKGRQDRRVRICMLGGLEVRVDGVLVPVSAFERRRAKSMLAVLAAVPGHVAKRFTLMESVWPEYDYATAHRCVYSATSVLRGEIGGLLEGDCANSIVLANKADRTLRLTMDTISCDVDDFERRAHQVVDGEQDDGGAVALCREIEDLYRGDMFVPATDGAGIMSTRRQELRALFSDAMVAGAEAALRLDHKMLACRFATKAHEADDMREDAVRVLLVALCAIGRHIEADRVYEHYVSHVVDVTRRPPSRRLRKIVGDLPLSCNSEGGASRTSPRQGQAEVIELKLNNVPEQLSFDFGDAAAG